ncbi:peptidase, M48 family (DUF45 domain) [Malaciobacter mytili LMG 24559]|uniref:M48 metallopeptidase family protein n=1 Tax=Malaciobacter mytili TaxID=603050 RepID=UPI000E109DAA|nr:YgjP-like metallopeptidase domain-containing protein [Malaciobacter mytili]AXH15892.1 peptidase, M48 family (DUF45 domain) [Malaciobacter mytili LMG 24559]
MDKISYINGYSKELQQKVLKLIEENNLGKYLKSKYPTCHNITNNKLLYTHAVSLKNELLNNKIPLSKIEYDSKINSVENALGLHTFISRVQGNKLKSKNEIKISTQVKTAPLEFLNLLIIHELAHFKHKEHNKAFYNLCEYMMSNYFQIEFDLRLYLTYLKLFGKLY